MACVSYNLGNCNSTVVFWYVIFCVYGLAENSWNTGKDCELMKRRDD